MLRKIRIYLWQLRWRLVLKIIDREWAADLLWDMDNNEQPVYSLEEAAQNIRDWSGEDEFRMTIQRAVSLPTREYRVVVRDVDDEDVYDIERIG